MPGDVGHLRRVSFYICTCCIFISMYKREEAALIRQEFWTTFGRYMAPVLSADGMKINWINYKSGFKDVQFKMLNERRSVITGIYLTHRDTELQEMFFDKFLEQQQVLNEITGYRWEWQLHCWDHTGKIISRIYQEQKGVSVFNKAQWPEIISFFKSRIISLDEFWSMARYSFDELR